MPIEEIYKHYKKSAGVITDSRNITKDCIFFALRGDNFNGNAFAAGALEAGAAYAVIDDSNYFTGDRCILVEDSLTTLQALARFHRKQLKIPFIGLTGTNGKTTTKELIHRVLSQKYKVAATSGNLNNHIGVPLTVLSIQDDAEIAVIEMGANHEEEIALLCEIADPEYGLITNIGKAHLEGFGGFEGVVRAKTELYTYLQIVSGTAIVNMDDELLMGLSEKLRRITYGTSKEAQNFALLKSSLPFLEIEWKGQLIDTELYGSYNFENILAALCFSEIFEIGTKKAAKAISSYRPDNSRSQLLKTASNLIYLDAYNANPSSMMASISDFEKQEGENKVIVLGDMLELGEESHKEHGEILTMVKDKFDTVILVGPEFSKLNIPPGVKVFIDTWSASDWLKNNPITHANILLKGSRGIAMEHLLDQL